MTPVTISPTAILGAKILIVDDQEANVLLLERMLHAEGYTSVTSTMEPDQVCPLHLVNRYDLILLDLQMPGMDGFQVMENLKDIEDGSYLPVLVITAQPAHKVRALKAGARDFVSKPFELAEVLVRVHNMLEVRLLHLQMRALLERIVAEQEVSKRLLLEMLPRSIAERVRANPAGASSNPDLIAESYAEVAVLFSNIVAFTKFTEGASAEVLTAVLDEVSAHLDDFGDAPREQGETIIEDAYLASVGLPDPVVDHTIEATKAALDLALALERFNKRSRVQLKAKIGFDDSPALQVAGGRREASEDVD